MSQKRMGHKELRRRVRRKATINWEKILADQVVALKLPAPELEHRFHGERRWRFDLAWPESLIAVEVDGGAWVGGRHTSGAGFEKDCEKMTEAAILGWRVLRVTPRWVKNGRALRYVRRALRV